MLFLRRPRQGEGGEQKEELMGVNDQRGGLHEQLRAQGKRFSTAASGRGSGAEGLACGRLGYHVFFVFMDY